MKSFLAAASLAVLSSASVHEFWAENNYICSLCENFVDSVNSGLLDEAFGLCRDDTNTDFTNICSKLGARISQIKKSTLTGVSSIGICDSLGYCNDDFEVDWSAKSAVDVAMIERINADETISWVAGENAYWKGATMEDVRMTLGSVVDPDYTYKLPEKDYEALDIELPTEFDSRTNWAYCADTIGHVRDQSACGSCWAFGSTEAYNDRLCIENKTFTQLLSTEDTTGCCTFLKCGGSMGCNGGQPSAAWSWFSKTGVVSGGDYDDIGKGDTCEPYSLKPCAHHVDSTEYAPCPSSDYPTPACTSQCSNSKYYKAWSDDKHKAKSAYSVRGVSKIEQDIYTYGTASAAFTVYEDFVDYKSGVYQHTSGSALGGHAIKMFGWGVEDGKDYWWCANSWNDSWGYGGFFKILKGSNECGIENDVCAGHA